jgi:hypothetical protein
MAELGQRISGLLVISTVIFLLTAPLWSITSVGASSSSAGQRSSPRRRQRQAVDVAPKLRVDYGSFSHRSHLEKQKLTCDNCHHFPSKNWKEVRKGDEAFPDVTDFPEHSACLICHRVQFFAKERPAPRICANCHIAVTPKNTARYLFPSVGEAFIASNRAQGFVSEIAVSFPHDKHEEVVGKYLPSQPEDTLRVIAVSFIPRKKTVQEPAPKSCPVCHQTFKPQGDSDDEFVTKRPKDLPEDAFWLKKGAFKTVPVSHALCFTCHSDESGIEPLPKNCGTCHKLAPECARPLLDFDPKLAASMGITDRLMLARWTRRSAGRFRHEFAVHAELSCFTCHNPSVMNTLDEKTFVSVKSCGGKAGGCHVEATDNGVLNYEIKQKRKVPGFQCTKCHITIGGQPVPADHLEVVQEYATR